jgi:hypothetical protein
MKNVTVLPFELVGDGVFRERNYYHACNKNIQMLDDVCTQLPAVGQNEHIEGPNKLCLLGSNSLLISNLQKLQIY